MRADTTPAQQSFVRWFDKALNDFRTRTAQTPAIVLLNPEEIDRVRNLGAESVEYRSKLFYLGVELGPDPRVSKGVAVACDKDLKWLGAFSWSNTNWTGDEAMASLGETWRGFKDKFDELLDRNAGLT